MEKLRYFMVFLVVFAIPEALAYPEEGGAASLQSENAKSVSDHIDIEKGKVDNQLKELQGVSNAITSPNVAYFRPFALLVIKLSNGLEANRTATNAVIKDVLISFNGIKCISYFKDYEKTVSDLFDQAAAYMKNTMREMSKSVGEAIDVAKQTQEELEALKHQARECDRDNCIEIEKQLSTILTNFKSRTDPVLSSQSQLIAKLDFNIVVHDLPLYTTYVEKGKTSFQQTLACLTKARNHHS